MHQLLRLVQEVDKTHPNLGRLTAVSVLAVKAKKFLLVVAPRGCGKSCNTNLLAREYKKYLMPERVTFAGLGAYTSAFSNFDGILLIDDMSKCGTSYVVAHTAATLAELCYSHRAESAVKGAHYRIEGFHGSIVANIQPALLRFLMLDPKWESSMMDKSIRYYHFYRPILTNRQLPQAKIDWGLELGEISEPNLSAPEAQELLEIGETAWGFTRLYEHITDLVQAACALDRRTTPNESDFAVLTYLLKPLKAEALVTSKEELEGETELANNQLAILTEFVTHGEFTMEQLCRDYRISLSTGYRIMNRFSDLWQMIDTNPTRFAPTPRLKQELQEAGLWHAHGY